MEELEALENEHNDLLAWEEAEWRMKSKEIWLKDGDKNTPFFHKQALSRISFNSIWKIKNHNGTLFNDFNTISEAGVHHFHNLYEQGQGDYIRNILLVASTFKYWMSEEDQEDLFAIVTRKEV